MANANDLLRRVAAVCSTPQEVADKMERIDAFQRSLWTLRNRRRSLVEEYDRNLRSVDKEIRDLQDSCDHSILKYHGDPSGNNDNYEECLICGKEEVRFRRK